MRINVKSRVNPGVTHIIEISPQYYILELYIMIAEREGCDYHSFNLQDTNTATLRNKFINRLGESGIKDGDTLIIVDAPPTQEVNIGSRAKQSNIFGWHYRFGPYSFGAIFGLGLYTSLCVVPQIINVQMICAAIVVGASLLGCRLYEVNYERAI